MKGTKSETDMYILKLKREGETLSSSLKRKVMFEKSNMSSNIDAIHYEIKISIPIIFGLYPRKTHEVERKSICEDCMLGDVERTDSQTKRNE